MICFPLLICKIELFYIGAVTRDCLRLFLEMEKLFTIQELKSIEVDVVSTVVANMNDRVNAAEERIQNPFANRTNIYRCEDGQPICYCCLRVGHVAKYCRHRKYSCQHVPLHDLTQPETSIPAAPFDLDAVGAADTDRLLKYLKGIAAELKKPGTLLISKTIEEIRPLHESPRDEINVERKGK